MNLLTLERDAQGVVVLDRDVAYEPDEETLSDVPRLRGIEPTPFEIIALEVELGGGRVERCAVVEHHAAAQAKRVGEPVGTDRPCLREPRDNPARVLRWLH